MPTIYRVDAELDEFQFLLEDGTHIVRRYLFDGRPIGKRWRRPAVYCPFPLQKAGAFLGCFHHSELLVATMETAGIIRRFLDESCERLPLRHEGRKLVLMNITYVVDCLDQTKSKHKPKMPDWIEEYAFHLDRIEHSLFKIPQTSLGEIYCVEGLFPPEDDFKATVERHGLTGLRFRKLWSDEV